MKFLEQAKSILITAAIICICLRIIVWAIMPLVPYIIVGLVLVMVLGLILFRDKF